MTEAERFERWEQQLNDSVKFTEREALQARTKIAHLDRTGKTKYPTINCARLMEVNQQKEL